MATAARSLRVACIPPYACHRHRGCTLLHAACSRMRTRRALHALTALPCLNPVGVTQ